MQQAVLYTRKRKDEPSREELGRIWKARMAEMEPRNRRVARNRPPTRSQADLERWHLRRRDAANRRSPSALHAVRQAVEHLEERRTVFTATMLRALVLAPGQWTLPQIDAAIARMREEGHLVEAIEGALRSRLRHRPGGQGRACRRSLDARRRRDAAGDFGIDAGEVERHLEAGTLNAGQKSAVATLLLSPRHVCGVQGHAGTGKTTMLRGGGGTRRRGADRRPGSLEQRGAHIAARDRARHEDAAVVPHPLPGRRRSPLRRRGGPRDGPGGPGRHAARGGRGIAGQHGADAQP